MQYDEPPYAFLRDVGDAMGRLLDEHIQRDHQHPDVFQAPTHVPHARMKIPDEDCARIIEIIETNDVTLEEAASYLGYPATLAMRAVATYMGRYKYWCDRITSTLPKMS